MGFFITDQKVEPMRVRATKDLAQLTDSAFYAEAAEGLGLVVANARRLYASATALAETKHFHGARVLQALSEEEASKSLILLDAVRCPRQPSDQFAVQLGRFNDHLAKGLYAHAYWWRPDTLGRLQEYLDHYREEFYLDGPNDVDWIFRNEIIQHREGELYVDYVAHDDGHSWLHPGTYDDIAFGAFIHDEPMTLQIAGCLHDVGVSAPDALATVAEVWQPIAMIPELQWNEIERQNNRTLECLNQKGLLRERPDSDYQLIVDRWQFPLYALDLSLLRVDIESLRERQRLWSPDW
jgi:AbiV family abortive infection protein